MRNGVYYLRLDPKQTNTETTCELFVQSLWGRKSGWLGCVLGDLHAEL